MRENSKLNMLKCRLRKVSEEYTGFFVLFLKIFYNSEIIFKRKKKKTIRLEMICILIWMVVTCKHFFELYTIIKKFFFFN